MKPRQKVVTAEDISSCLYYLHLDCPEDVSLVNGPGASGDGRKSSDQAHNKGHGGPDTVPRKPLPFTPQPTIGILNPSMVPQSYYQDSTPASVTDTQLSRKPVGGMLELQTNYEMTERPRSAPALPRRPLGPRSADAKISHAEGRVQGKENLTTNDECLNGVAPLDRGRTAPVGPSNITTPLTQEAEHTMKVSSSHTSLTVIRRDPSSGSQWNIGKIINVPSSADAPGFSICPPITSTRESKSSMIIHINTLGYNKFLPPQQAFGAGIEKGLPADGASFTDRLKQASDLVNAQNARKFERHLWIDDSGTRGPTSELERPVSSGVLSETTTSRNSVGWKQYSERPALPDMNEYMTSLESGRRRFQDSPERTSAKAKGYVFLSPWKGICAFSTGSGGRTLKCRHSLPDGSTATTTTPSVTVSELRFNLPGFAVFSTPSSKLATPSATDRNAKRASFFSSRTLHTQPSSNTTSHLPSPSKFERPTTPTSVIKEVHDVDDLDLSLGREKAGGGFGGKQAKLGKLIIEDEGLKMLDLLVTANMALWWKVYDRAEGNNG
ncbi:MAG: hypothetical protein M1827_000288 [Pycnora praestabilis]|nr:MAG: hypothetical protein M1827_000288 [Pycnora praestabilis]